MDSQLLMNMPSSSATIPLIEEQEQELFISQTQTPDFQKPSSSSKPFMCKKIKFNADSRNNFNPKTAKNASIDSTLSQTQQQALFFQMKFSKKLQSNLFTHKLK